MQITIYYITLLLFLVVQNIGGQTHCYKHYNSQNGLPSSEVYHVIQDSKGYMWFSTNQGVSRYDGNRFENFDITDGLADNTVFDAYEDYKGRIWFTSLSGKLTYYHKGTFNLFAFNDSIIKPNGSVRTHISKRAFHLDSDDNIYLTHIRRKPIKIDSVGNVNQIDLGEKVIVKVNENGTIVNNFTLTDSVQIVIDRQDTIKLDSIYRFYSNNISSSVTTEKHIILTSGKNFCVINRQYKTVKYYKSPDTIIWLSCDNNETVWIGTHNEGALGFKDSNFDTPAYKLLKGHSASSVYRDIEGGVWITTLENGVFFYPNLNIKVLSQETGLKNSSLNTVCSNGQYIWFGGNSPYLYSYNSKNKIKEWNFSNYGLWHIGKLEFLNKQLLISGIGTRSGVYFLKNNKVKYIHPTFCKDFYKTKEGWIMMADANGNEHKYKDGLLKIIINSSLHKLSVKYIYDIYYDKDGSKWYATEQGLILQRDNKCYNMADSSAVYKHRISCLTRFNGKLIIGTKGGGLLLKKGNTVKKYTTLNGLPSNSISDIEISNDTVWLGTNNGVARFIGEPNADNINTWSIANGLIDDEVTDIALFEDKIFVATGSGLNYFDINLTGKNTTPPLISMDKIKINNKDTLLHNKYLLNYKNNHLTLTFTGINYQRNKDIEYKYRLKGLKKSWIQTTNNQASYLNLSPGKYIFEVYAINNSNILSSNPAIVSFIIEKPYWQKIWFISLITFLTICVIFASTLVFFKTRLSIIEKRNLLEQELNVYRQKALSSQMNPHFLYNSLNSAQYYILNSEPNIASDYLSSLGRLMRIILNNSQHEQISLKDELEALYFYIEMEQQRFDYNFNFRKNISKEVNPDTVKIPPLLLQPYAENAIHHGLRNKKGEKLLELEITKNENNILVIIKDNGIGRNKSNLVKNKQTQTYTSLGTKISQARLSILEEIHSIKMFVEIIDLYDANNLPSGTKVTLTIKS